MGDQNDNETMRVCPSCEKPRPANMFKSSHPRTHCDECHASKKTAANAPTEPPDAPEEGPPTKSMRPPTDSGASAPQTPDATDHADPSVGGSGEETDATTAEGGGPEAPPAPAESSTDNESTTEPEPGETTEDPRAARARRRRLDRRDPTIPSHCPVTGRAIDSGPRADVWSRPTKRDGEWVSALAGVLIDARATPDELLHVLGLLESIEG